MTFIQLSHSQAVSMGNEWYELADPDHFWIQWRFQVLRLLAGSYLKPETSVLEIGCGNGLVMWQMERDLHLIPDGCDLNINALSNMMPVSGKVYLYDIFDLNPDLVGRFDVVMMLDILEHIDYDHAFLLTAMQYLKPGGIMVVGVPAHAHLYSKYDRLVGHVRRYERRQLRKLFDTVGMQSPVVWFWGCSMLPLLFIRRFYLRLLPDEKVISKGFKPPHPLFNRMMLALMRAELRLFSKVPVGISLMAVGQKPA